jgi:hypothetical protein
MKSAYQFQLEQQQRRLGLSNKQLNKYDRKYNNINLIRYLQSLAPVALASKTGFYGTLAVTNITVGLPVSFQVKLAFNNLDITNYVTINGGQTQTITVPIGSRLPNPASLLQYKIIFDSTAISVNGFEDITGFSAVSNTDNPLNQENTVDLLIDAGYIDGGGLIQAITIDAT